MGSDYRHTHMRWLLFVGLTLSSFLFTGCEKGSLGVKNGTVQGFVYEFLTNKPVADVLISGKHATQNISMMATTGADGKYTLNNLEPGAWDIVPSKPGYFFLVASETESAQKVTATIQNGETTTAPIIRMIKNIAFMKGTLKGYPVDAITGNPLSNFTVKQTSPDEQIKSKLFESATDFKEGGWTGLEGGSHDYQISADNYQPTIVQAIKITNGVTDLGLVKMNPMTLSISGTLRNLPGYVIGQDQTQPDSGNWSFWAEASGKVVATNSSTAGDSFKGTVVYTLNGVPVTAGQVSIKCKIRGYDLTVINPAVSISAQRPSGTIAGIDCDFANVEPIRRDLRVVVQSGNKPEPDNPSSFLEGEVARVYVRQGGQDVVPYVDVVGHNHMAEATFSGLPTGYPLEVLVVNLSRGYISGGKSNVLLQENGDSQYTVQVLLSVGGGPN